MDYSRLTFRAVVDFVEVAFVTCDPTQGRWINKKTGTTYAIPCDPQTGSPYENARHLRTTTHFRARLYDPENFADVRAAIDTISAAFELASEPTVTALEIALDAYSDSDDLDALAELAALYPVRLKSLAAPLHRRRVYRDGVGSAAAIPTTKQSLVRHVRDGWQIGIGNPNDAESQHAYLKTTDRNGAPLRAGERPRARLETRQQGAALRDRRGVETLESLRLFQFQRLSDCFYCRVLSDDVTGVIRTISATRTQNLSERPEVSTLRRKFAVGTQADSRLNKIISKRLENLTKRW